MSAQNPTENAAAAESAKPAEPDATAPPPVPQTTPTSPQKSTAPAPAPNSNATTPASSITGGPTSKLRAPKNFGGSTGTVSKIGRPCSHAAPKAGPPPRDKSMSRESDDNLSSINSQYTDLYQETVERFTRSSLSPEMERYSPSRNSTKSTSTSQKSDAADWRHAYDLYLEATGRRRSSDHGAVLTHDTEQFIIGQKVWVGGIRPGQIAYIGETHFAPGDWAGIVLDEPNGKNDGCVAGKRYFQCEAKRGIFSRLTRLTLAPLPGAHTPTSPISKNSPERSRTVSPTASIRSSFLRSPGKNGLTVGDRIIVSSGFGSRPGILRYLGETQFASGNWCGVELDDPTGKNDGAVDGIRYFECKPKYGVFVPIAKVSLSPSSKKSRLSRTGSRESLNSIGTMNTMNSIATTNTSRLRMNAQRKPFSIKPIVSTPKSQFSMQDLLHEKQKHIEQLMIERDLDREDSQNQALLFQKNINELKSRVVQLERALEEERKKSEDLQFSIDEATFCGDEFNAQSHVYKEKIQDLEQKLTELTSGTPSQSSLQSTSLPDTSAALAAATDAANAKVAELGIRLQYQTKEYETRLRAAQDEEKRLQENIQYLQIENETLQKELLEKDESLEKFSLSESGIDNLRRELLLLKEENEKERQQANADFQLKLQTQEAEIKRLTEKLTVQQNSQGTLESERANMEDECEILRMECKTRDGQVQELNAQLAQLKAELSMQRAENATLDELLKAQQQGSVEGKTALEQKIIEIEQLKQEIARLQSAKTMLESSQQTAMEELKKLADIQRNIEQKLKETTSADEEKQAALVKLEIVMEELKTRIREVTVENEQLQAELQNMQEARNSFKANEEVLHSQLKERDSAQAAALTELHQVKELARQREEELAHLAQNSEQAINEKTKEIERLNAEIEKLQSRTKALEGESSATVQQMSAQLGQLEAEVKKLRDTLKQKEEALEQRTQTQVEQQRLLTEQASNLNFTAAALENANSLLDKLRQEREQVVSKCAGLEELLRQRETSAAQLQLDLGDQTRKLEAMSKKCESLETQSETLQRDLLAARSSGNELQTEIRKLNEELAARQKTYAELQSSGNDERHKLEGQLEELNQKLATTVSDFEALKDSAQKAKDELTKKQEQITALEEKTIKQELALSDAQRQQENLQAKYDALAAQNESLQRDLTALRTTSTDSNAELLKLSQDMAAKQKAYEELLDKTNSERAMLEGQLQAGQQRIDALCSQVETLTQELKSSSEESFQRFELLRQEQDKNGKQALELSDLTRKLETLNTKCAGVEVENAKLQQDLASARTTSTDTNAEVLKLTEELNSKQRALQEFTDKSSAERLQLDSQLQQLKQQLQATQSDAEQLRNELKLAAEAKNAQAVEFENIKVEMQRNEAQKLQDAEEKAATERKQLKNAFEVQLKTAEQTKCVLDEAISSLQNQIKLLQDELLKSQLDFKAKEEELGKQVVALSQEVERSRQALQQVQSEGSNTLNSAQQQRAELLHNIDELNAQLKARDDQLLASKVDFEQLKLSQANDRADASKLQDQTRTLQNALELAQSELEHKSKLAEADKVKLDELRGMLDAMQAVNANISTTNAELSEALQVLEQEKCETANIFELFEMESDQNAAKLLERLSEMKQQLADAQGQLQQQDSALAERQQALDGVSAKLEASQSALAGVQLTVLEQTTKLGELTVANAELKQAIDEKEAVVQQQVEVEAQLSEYKKVIDELDDSAKEQCSKVEQMLTRIEQLEEEKRIAVEAQKTLKVECAGLQRRLEVMDLEKTRKIVALQGRVNDLQSIAKLKQSNGAAGGDPAANLDDENEDSVAQINFLNSIIADMQKKNDTLKAKIEALEALPTDYMQSNPFELLAKRQPAPRVFCDICDEFDKHETEDCPLQASDDRDYSPTPNAERNNNDPANKKDRKLPEPRKYCESCEVFGHETGECADDECY